MRLETLPKILICALLLFTMSCGSANQASSSGNQSNGVILPDYLTAVDSNLSGEIFVYDENGNRILTDDMLFDTDSDNNDIAVTPPMTLNKSQSYRFIIVFSLSGTPVAHVDVVATVSDAATTNLTYTTDDIINNSSGIDDILLSDVSAGILPNLDLDGDGYSNLEEINGYSDPNDPESIPAF